MPVQAGQGISDNIRQLIELDGAAAVADVVIDRQRPLVRKSFLAGHASASNKMADAYVDAFVAEMMARRGQFIDLIVGVAWGKEYGTAVHAAAMARLKALG